MGGLLIFLIAFIVWWFWLYKNKEVVVTTGDIKIVLENGVYQPARLKLAAGKPITLQFFRKDASPCTGRGEYPFYCQMKMYRGRLFVK